MDIIKLAREAGLGEAAMTDATRGTKYPYYKVEGRRFSDEEYHLAVYFARHMANKMDRPVHLIRALDHMTPSAVIYTAEPEADHV